jgi:oxalate decarboxylase/phosphoglucose isomerase-like protein (cupin superfamily)
MRLKPGAIRELKASAATDDFEPGDMRYFQKGFGHSIQNIGREEAHFVLG